MERDGTTKTKSLENLNKVKQTPNVVDSVASDFDEKLPISNSNNLNISKANNMMPSLSNNGKDDERLVNIIALAMEKVVDKKMSSFESLLNKVDNLLVTNNSKSVIESKELSQTNDKEKKKVDDSKTTVVVEKKEKSEDKKSSKKEKEPSEPKILELSYKVNCISDVDPVSCTFSIDIKVFMYWDDPKLIGRAKGDVDYTVEKGLFEPDIIVTNDHDLSEVEKDQNTKVVDSKKGSVKRTMHYKGTVFLGSMDLALFPFDCQNLQVRYFILNNLMKKNIYKYESLVCHINFVLINFRSIFICLFILIYVTINIC